MYVVEHLIGEKKRRSKLSELDIELLKLIWDYKYLALYQIEYYFERLYGIKKDSIRKKLLRWREKKLVISKEYTRRPWAKICYRLGQEGIDVLKATGLIHKNSVMYLDYISARNKYDHFFGIRDAVLLSLINLNKNHTTVKSFPPSSMPYYEKGMEGKNPLVVPDWILVNAKGYLDIELDTGSESLNIFNLKVKNYGLYASQHSNDFHHVLVVIIDENDKGLKYSSAFAKDRSGRVANLKEVIINTNAHIYPNLNFYVVTVSNVGPVACNILSTEYSTTAEKQSDRISKVSNAIELNHAFKYEVEYLNADEFYLADVNESLYADGHFLIKNMETRRNEVVLIKLMEEGSVRCLDQIDYLNRLQSENRFKKPVNKILGIYQSNKELQNDVLGKVLLHVYFTSIEQLEEEQEDNFTVYQTVNTARMEGVPLFER